MNLDLIYIKDLNYDINGEIKMILIENLNEEVKVKCVRGK